jgi:hypothetical protein
MHGETLEPSWRLPGDTMVTPCVDIDRSRLQTLRAPVPVLE